jgi:signal transduction histidine kinase
MNEDLNSTPPILIADRFIPISFNLFVVFLVLLAVTALSFEPLERLMRRITNRIFFAGSYDSDTLLSELTHIMAETIDLEALTDQILKTLMGSMNISKGTFLIMREHVFVNIFGVGYDKRLLTASGFEGLFHKPFDTVPYFLFDGLEEESLKQLFRSFEVAVAIPIRVEKREVALLILGEKMSGEMYYSEDLKFLTTFALNAGVAIDNAQSYAEIKEFNKELEGRVEERTKELRETEERELAEARNVARLKDEFVFIAAHELRTPIAAIKGFLQMVSETSVKFPKDVRENLKAINSASDILNQLINDLLEIARSESGTVKVSVQPTDVVPIVKSVLKEMSSLARKQKVRMAFHSRGKIPSALVDSDKVKEVIMNLVSNGIKYNKAGGTLAVSVSKKRSSVVMEFKDTGYGIPEDQEGHIFQKFFRVRGKNTQEVSGTGLGLFIVRMLTDKMGGAVTFKSSEGKGSTFTVSFPLEK